MPTISTISIHWHNPQCAYVYTSHCSCINSDRIHTIE